MPFPTLKPVVWLGDSVRELKTFPAAVQEEVGYALYLAQRGERHGIATPQSDIELIERRLKQAVAIREAKE